MKLITAEELEQKINGGEEVNIIDVRESDEVAMGKIPGAKHIPLGEISDRLVEMDKKKHYYMVCRSGARTGHACLYLTQMGFNVTNVVGGMNDWEGKQV